MQPDQTCSVIVPIILSNLCMLQKRLHNLEGDIVKEQQELQDARDNIQDVVAGVQPAEDVGQV